MASTSAPADHLVWARGTVDSRTMIYGAAGEGLPVVFLHGWALGSHTYKRALKRLVSMGCRVYAPALPGFGGTAALPAGRFSFAGYASWVAAFLDAVGIEEPVFLVGHSFGGGVAIQTAHDHPERVRSLVLVNSIGGGTWHRGEGKVRSMSDRPLWDWGIHLPADVPVTQMRRVLPVILEDAVPNVVRNPLAVWRVAQLARRADLTVELEELKRRQLPVVVLWGDKDRIVTRDSFEALCAAIGSEGEVVAGNHSWLLADPDSFAEVITNVVSVAQLARAEEAARAAREGVGSRGAVSGRRRLRRVAEKAGAARRS